MCVVSMIGDHYNEKWDPLKNFLNPNGLFNGQIPISREEFNNLKKEVDDLKELLKKAKIYDVVHDEPNCELEEKMKFLREVAKLVGVNLDDVINNNGK